MKDGWLQHEELRLLSGWNDRKIQREAFLGPLEWKLSAERRDNGRRPREYLISSLPIELQRKLLAQSAAADPSSDQGQNTQLSLLSAPTIGLPDERPILLSSLTQRSEAQKRWSAISPILDYSRLERGAERISWCGQKKIYVASRDDLIRLIAKQENVAPSTIYGWLKQFSESGLAGLARKARNDKGRSRWIGADDRNLEIVAIAAHAFLAEKLSKRMAWEIACTEARRRNLSEPSYETVRTLLANVPAPIKTYALSGRRRYEEMFAPYVSRGYEDFEANEIWVSDHALHDVLVQNDLFDARDRQHMRLRFTGLECMRSRRIVAYAWSQEGSSRSITTCLRQALESFGPARVFYCDNGKDYQKVGRGADGGSWNMEDLTPEALGVIARLKIAVKYCQPFHPQAKLIERFNNTLHQRFDRRFLTYTGPTPEQRPDRCIAALERHKRLLAAGHPEDSDLPLASEFIRAAAVWIEAEYNQTSKHVRGMKGLTPNEAFEKFRWSGQLPVPAPDALIPLLQERAQCTVRECVIQLRGRRYQPADDIGWQRMHHYTTGSVLVAYDPFDLASVAAIDENGQLICTLQPEPLLRQADDEETGAQILASMEMRGTLRRNVREDLAALGRRVRSGGYVPQHEQILALGRLPIPIGDLVVQRTPKRKSVEEDQPKNNLVPGEASDRLAARLLRRA